MENVEIVESNNSFLSRFWTAILEISSYKFERVDVFEVGLPSLWYFSVTYLYHRYKRLRTNLNIN